MLNHAARFSFRRGMTILSLKGTWYLPTSRLRVSASGRTFKAPRPLALARSSPAPGRIAVAREATFMPPNLDEVLGARKS